MRAALLVCGILAALVTSGCATVRPWERERLADRAMHLDADPLAAEMEQHNHDYREGASGGFGGAGGGCGCN